MTLKISFAKAPAAADTAIAFVGTDKKLGPAAAKIDKESGGAIAHHLKNRKSFGGKSGQAMIVSAPKGSKWMRFVLLGLGDAKKADHAGLQAAGGKLYAALAGGGHAALFADGPAENAAHVLAGMKLRSYRFDKYKSKPKESDPMAPLPAVTVAGDAKIKKFFAPLEALAEGVFFARDLANEPPNVLYPESFAALVKKELAPLGVQVEIIDAAKMKKLGFGSHLSVGQGSAKPPCAVIMRWKGKGGKSTKGKKQGPLAFVGKGVTFDTGGISIKPSAGMEDMKFDMCGAAAVAGTMKALALRKSSADVVGVAGLAENMPGGNASRPSDIVKSLSGKTIENLNTDAEGRLVLCDALAYVQKTYDPRLIVDLATLTGAIVVALGSEYAGAFVNDDGLWKRLDKAGNETGEKLWRMPLAEAYRKSMESAIADLRNTSTAGRDAGSCTAAGFLEQFIDKGRPWAHLDIAGVAWVKGDKPTAPKPAPGFGVQLLNQFVAENYE